jgi:flagellar hook protein FlgE
VQGWLKNLNPANNDTDVTSTNVDTTAPITNIIVEPGLRIPSKETSSIEMKANLNSGKKIINKSSMYETDGIDGRTYSKDVDAIIISGNKIINEKSLDKLGKITNYNKNAYVIGTDLGIATNVAGEVISLRSAKFTPTFQKVGTEAEPLDAIDIALNKKNRALNQNSVDGQGLMISILDRDKVLEKGETDQKIYYQFRYTDGNKEKGHPDSSRIHPINGTIMRYDDSVDDFATKPTNVLKPLNSINNYELENEKIVKDVKVVYFTTDEELRLFMQSIVRDPGQRGPIIKTKDAEGKTTKTWPLSPDKVADEIANAEKDDKGVIKDFDKFFTNLKFPKKEDEAEGFNFEWQNDTNISINDEGKLVLINKKSDNRPIEWDIESIKDTNTTPNDLFTRVINSVGGIVDADSKVTSVPLKAPAHASSIHIFDSLGSRHSLRFEFTKISNDSWAWKASVPEPATLGGGYPPDENVQRGGILTFTNNGALKSFSPPTITFTGNNGSKPNQVIQIDLGTLGDFDGISQLDAPSSSQGIKQDGFSGGDLTGTRIDDVGTLIGAFSNGRSFALGQIALASFTNNSGLKSVGNNLFSESSNSGNPVIGVSKTGGKGGIQSSSLEFSNVDLSRSLTQLIALQRGFQANGKTITTSDALLNTLIQLKN